MMTFEQAVENLAIRPVSGSDAANVPGDVGPAKKTHGRAGKRTAAKPEQKSKQKSKTAQPVATRASTKAGSKQDKVLSMLKRKEGASIAAIMKATGWQKHSVHGFLAGVVRKKLGLTLRSDEVDSKRIYRIVSGKASKAPARKRSR